MKIKYFLVIFCGVSICTLSAGEIMEPIQTNSQNIDVLKANGKYQNWVPGNKYSFRDFLPGVWKWLKGGKNTTPNSEIPIVKLNTGNFINPPDNGLSFRWLGHSSVLLEIEGQRILLDPVFLKYASPVQGLVKRFSKSPLSSKDLPFIDIVLISHDHYDHLEKETVKDLANKNAKFIVPVGVGERLEKWGISSNQIKELSWWENAAYRNLNIVCVPSRHFSGRGITDKNETLWCGWVIKGKSYSVYYSGDTGPANHFKKIGQLQDSIDLTIIKIGAYGSDWPDIHVNPEQAIQAHIDVKGKIMLPVHWSTFNLALHSWDEPIKRIYDEAIRRKVTLTTPIIGDYVDTLKPLTKNHWWENIK